MSTKRALYRLESVKPVDEAGLMVHLAKFLGAVDGVLWPARFTSVSNYHAIMDAQKKYHRQGISYVVPGSDESAWKTSQRIRDAMIEAGWAVDCGNGKLRISPLGDCVARTACGLPTQNSEITRLLFQLLGELKPERSNCWVSEGTLFQMADDRDSSHINYCTEFVAPLLASRSIEAVSSTVARCFYRKLADSLPMIDAPEIERSDDALDQYTQSFCKTMGSRKLATYSGTEIFIPLAATR